MNHLAHVFLSGKDENIMMGNLIADFITGRETRLCAPKFLPGIQLHYAIDVYTDAHPIVKESTKHLHPYHHKYAPVVVDVFYDFFLARHWSVYAPHMNITLGLREFVNHTYTVLQKNIADFPEKLSKPLPNMIKNDWLFQSTQLEGQKKIFSMLHKRANFENNFNDAVNHLLEFQSDLEKEFNLFFPDLIAHVLQLKIENR